MSDEAKPRRARHANAIAKVLWNRAGKPDGHDLGEVSRHSYDDWTDDVLWALDSLGLKIVRK